MEVSLGQRPRRRRGTKISTAGKISHKDRSLMMIFPSLLHIITGFSKKNVGHCAKSKIAEWLYPRQPDPEKVVFPQLHPRIEKFQTLPRNCQNREQIVARDAATKTSQYWRFRCESSNFVHFQSSRAQIYIMRQEKHECDRKPMCHH